MRRAAVAGILLLTCGCLSVCRVCKLDMESSVQEWSEERQEWVSVPLECSPEDRDFMSRFGLYPTLKMRWQLLRLACHWVPKRERVGVRVGVPIALVGITPGMLVDIVVDTISLPWDWKYRDNVSPDLCAQLDVERAYRSLCVICGATSDGEFARCRRENSRGTADWRTYYGVCPACIDKAKSRGYYFR